MKKKSQADRLAAMVSQAQNVPRPSNLADDYEKPESRKAVLPENFSDETVTIGAKVYKDLAYFWTAQGKVKRQSVSDVVRQALVDAFGLPEGFPLEAVKPENRKTGKTD